MSNVDLGQKYGETLLYENGVKMKEHSVLEICERAGLTIFLNLAKRCGMIDSLAGPGLVTVFAPINEAFESDKPHTAEYWASLSEEAVRRFVSSHILPCKYEGGLTKNWKECSEKK